jgi:hypothetical protein
MRDKLNCYEIFLSLYLVRYSVEEYDSVIDSFDCGSEF